MNTVTQAAGRDFVAELQATKRGVSDAGIATRIAEHGVKEFESQIADLEKLARIHPLNRREAHMPDDDQIKIDLSSAKEKVRKKYAELETAREKEDAARSALARIQKEIRENPIYAEAVKKVSELRQRAGVIAHASWTKLSIPEILSARSEFDRLSDLEQTAIAELNPILRDARLPQFRPILYFEAMNVLPAFILTAPVKEYRTAAAHAIKALIEIV